MGLFSCRDSWQRIKTDKIAYEASLCHNALKLNLTTSSFLTINCKIMETWAKNWNDVLLRNKLRNINSLVKKWNFPSSLKRRDEVVITQIRIGYTHFTYHFLISKELTSVCYICKENLLIDDIVIRCPKYAEARTILNNLNSFRLAVSEQNTETIYQFFHTTNLSLKL